jgi:hypothetical protein
MFKTFGSGGTGIRIELEHGFEELGELVGLDRRPLVLLSKDLVEIPGFQARYVSKFALLVEEVSRMAASQSYASRYLAEELDYVR